MSHFTVLVTKTDETSAEEQLEPFYEQGEDGDYFMEHEIEVPAENMKAEAERIIGEYKSWHTRSLKERRQAKKELEGKTKPEGYDHTYSRLVDQAKYDGKQLEAAKVAQKLYDAGEFEEIVQNWHGGEIDDDGNLYFLTNPDARWDWWEVGGRWSGYLKLKATADVEPVVTQHWGREEGHAEELKEDRRTDVARVKDVDWEGMRKADLEKAEKNWAEYEKKLAAGEDFNPYFDFGVEKDMTKEEYMKKSGSIATFAVLHDGEWYERGSMGWWAMVSDEKPSDDWNDIFESILSKLDPEDELTVVDCHI